MRCISHSPLFVDCFSTCKNLLSSELVLAYADFSKSFELLTDTSNFVTGCVLLQTGFPILYASRILNAAEIDYSSIDKECLAIVFGCKCTECYLYGGNSR